MNFVYIILLNLILIFIFYVILNHKINKNSTSTLLEKYAREVENLIVELNGAVDTTLNLSEEKINELKKLVKKAEKLLKNTEVKKVLSESSGEMTNKIPELTASKNLMEKTHHLLSMGHSKEEIAKILHINRAEVDFLESLISKG
jgi:hypothetical protein